MTTKTTVRIATRKSPLALWQANTTAKLLEMHGYETALVPLVTTGDVLQKGALSGVHISAEQAHLQSGKGLFVKEVQESLLAGESNLAVHSMKDLPVAQTTGLVTAAVLPRAPAEDVLIFSPALLDAFVDHLSPTERTRVAKSPEGLQTVAWVTVRDFLRESSDFFAKPIGTTSARRQALSRLAFGDDLQAEVLRGNVETRLARVARGEFSAILLAKAGLNRLGLYKSSHMYALPFSAFTPAPAQGIVALECPERDFEVREALALVSCPDTAATAAIERLALWMLGGDCHTAIGAHWRSPNLTVFCATEQSTQTCVLEAEERHLAELAHILERERGYYHGHFETLKHTTFARALYVALRSANFETLIPWHT